MEKIKSTLEVRGPDPEIMDLTKRIVEQNGKVLAMNERLLVLLSSPAIFVDAEAMS